MKLAIAFILLAYACHAANTNKVDKADKTDKVEKEKKTEHLENKITIKERDKGSKKESDWMPAREYPLMFGNNRKAKKEKK
jgi:hypothetical protein